MSLVDYKYHYGHGYKNFSLDNEHVMGELKTQPFAQLPDLKAAVLDALYHPIGSASGHEDCFYLQRFYACSEYA